MTVCMDSGKWTGKWAWGLRPGISYAVEFLVTFALVTLNGIATTLAPEYLRPVLLGGFICVAVTALGSAADIHLNPAISWAAWVVDPLELTYLDSTFYIALQYLGGLCGGLCYMLLTPQTFFFHPPPPYTMISAFVAEGIFSGVLCFVALGWPNLEGRGGFFITSQSSTAWAPSSSSLTQIEEGSGSSKDSSKLYPVRTGKKRHYSRNAILLLKGVIMGSTVAVCTYCCRGFSGASLNPAMWWAANMTYTMQHGSGSVYFWSFVPYSLATYISGTIAGLIHRVWNRRRTVPEGKQENCFHCDEGSSLLRSSREPCEHAAI